MKQIFTFSIVILCTVLFADARKGELFGYKIGDPYPLTDSTKGRLHWLGQSLEIVAEKPVKPSNMSNVTVVTTLKTHTIVGIRSETEFSEHEKARAFALSFAEVFRAKYKLESWKDDYQDLLSATKAISWSSDLSSDYSIRIFLPAPIVTDAELEEFMEFLHKRSRSKTNALPSSTPATRQKSHSVEISLMPIGHLQTNLTKQAESEYDAVLLEQAKKSKLLDGL